MTILSAETSGQENVVLAPNMVQGSNFVVLGTLAAAGATFHPSSVIPKNRVTPQLLQLHGMPAGTSAGQILVDVTRGSQAFVDSVSVGVATMTQPFTTTSTTTVQTGFEASPAEDDSWANTDTFQLYTVPLYNLKVLNTNNADTATTALTTPTVWVQYIHIPDISGSPGYSQYISAASSVSSVVYSNVWFDPTFIGQSELASYDSSNLSCWHNGGMSLRSWGAIGGASSTTGSFFLNGSYLQDLSVVDGDIILHKSFTAKGGYSLAGYAYTDTGPSGPSEIAASQLRIEPYDFANSILWGPGAIDLNSGGSLVNESGTTWANCLTVTGALTLDGASTGWSPPATGTVTLNGTAAVTITGVNGTNAFPANATFTLSLHTVGGTPGTTAPYFFTATTANAAQIKSGTTNANDVYNWNAAPTPGVSITAGNIDIYQRLWSPISGSYFGPT